MLLLQLNFAEARKILKYYKVCKERIKYKEQDKVTISKWALDCANFSFAMHLIIESPNYNK